MRQMSHLDWFLCSNDIFVVLAKKLQSYDQLKLWINCEWTKSLSYHIQLFNERNQDPILLKKLCCVVTSLWKLRNLMGFEKSDDFFKQHDWLKFRTAFLRYSKKFNKIRCWVPVLLLWTTWSWTCYFFIFRMKIFCSWKMSFSRQPTTARSPIPASPVPPAPRCRPRPKPPKPGPPTLRRTFSTILATTWQCHSIW